MPDINLSHIQIGSGKLALGLIIPVLQEIGLPTTIVNRLPKDKSSLRCHQLKTDKSFLLEIGENKKIINFSQLIYFTDTIPRSIITSPILLITTAVTQDGLSGIIKYLANLLNERAENSNDNSLTFIIACENMHENSEILKGQLRQYALANRMKTLLQSLNTQCAFLNTVVDRICNFPEPYPIEQATIRTEQDYEWIVDVTSIIHKEPWIKILKDKFGSHWNITTNPYFGFYEKRKTWFVNGGQLILAAYTRKFEDQHLDRALRKTEINDKIDSVFRAFSYALDYYKESVGIANNGEMSIEANLKYGKCVKERISEFEDTVTRIIASLMKADRATDELNTTLKELNKKNPDIAKIKSGITNLITALEIIQFTERVESRIIDAVDSLLEYNQISNDLLFKEDPNMAAEVIRMCNECLRLINSESGRTARSLRQALQ